MPGRCALLDVDLVHIVGQEELHHDHTQGIDRDVGSNADEEQAQPDTKGSIVFIADELATQVGYQMQNIIASDFFAPLVGEEFAVRCARQHPDRSPRSWDWRNQSPAAFPHPPRIP